MRMGIGLVLQKRQLKPFCKHRRHHARNAILTFYLRVWYFRDNPTNLSDEACHSEQRCWQLSWWESTEIMDNDGFNCYFNNGCEIMKYAIDKCLLAQILKFNKNVSDLSSLLVACQRDYDLIIWSETWIIFIETTSWLDFAAYILSWNIELTSLTYWALQHW